MNGPWTRLRSLGATERTFNHTGLRPDDTRHYQMRACNGAGCGHWSSPSSATVLPGVPYAPGLTARANSASEIKLSWTKPNDGGSAITSYELEHYTDGSDWTSLDGNISSDVREYFHQKEFGGGTTHRYRVRAVNAEGEGRRVVGGAERHDLGAGAGQDGSELRGYYRQLDHAHLDRA